MLHLCLARNMLVAVSGGDVKFYDEAFLPTYPAPMLHRRHPTLMLHLAPCTPELVRDCFMEFERPTPVPGSGKPPKGWYATIGEFYQAVAKGLTDLDAELGPRLWAKNQPTVQYVSAYWNNDGGGEPLLVENLPSALSSIKMIMEQGEGIDPGATTVPVDPHKPVPGLNEMPHYTEFAQIGAGIDPLGPVWKLPTDPKAADYQTDAAITSINTLFNASYCYVLHMLDLLYATSWKDMKPGTTNKRCHYERTFISAMQGILVSVAEAMVATPVTKGPTAARATRARPSSTTSSRASGSGNISSSSAMPRCRISPRSAEITGSAGSLARCPTSERRRPQWPVRPARGSMSMAGRESRRRG